MDAASLGAELSRAFSTHPFLSTSKGVRTVMRILEVWRLQLSIALYVCLVQCTSVQPHQLICAFIGKLKSHIIEPLKCTCGSLQMSAMPCGLSSPNLAQAHLLHSSADAGVPRGMACIAAFLLAVLGPGREEDAFWTFAGLLENRVPASCVLEVSPAFTQHMYPMQDRCGLMA